MQGVITSRDGSVNRYGVPLAKLLDAERQANARLVAALTNALVAWRDYHQECKRRKAKQKSTQKVSLEQLRELAKELTDRALA
jgi:hypothetical protein